MVIFRQLPKAPAGKPLVTSEPESVYVLREGEVVEQGTTSDVLDNPQHWYTRKLVDSIPSSDETWLAQADETALSTPQGA